MSERELLTLVSPNCNFRAMLGVFKVGEAPKMNLRCMHGSLGYATKMHLIHLCMCGSYDILDLSFS